MFACPATDDFFRSRIDHMIDLRHPLAVLASRMPWQEIEARVAQVFSRKGRAGVAMPDLDLFGEQVQRVAVASNAGRPRVPLRVMIALLYLKHAFNESDEGVVERWGETPTWQFFSGCAYDGRTLYEQLEQTTILMQDSAAKPATAFVDLGYRGVDAQNPDVHIVHRGKSKRISEQERKLLKRRQAIEPIIGHLKADHRMDRCHLKGKTGDRLHAVLCAAGYNIRWLLRMIAKKGVTFLRQLYLRLCMVADVSPNWQDALGALLTRALTGSGYRPVSALIRIIQGRLISRP